MLRPIFSTDVGRVNVFTITRSDIMDANKPALITYGVGSLVTFIIAFIFYLKIEALEYASILEKISFAIPGIICFAIGAFFLICFRRTFLGKNQ